MPGKDLFWVVPIPVPLYALAIPYPHTASGSLRLRVQPVSGGEGVGRTNMVAPWKPGTQRQPNKATQHRSSEPWYQNCVASGKHIQIKQGTKRSFRGCPFQHLLSLSILHSSVPDFLIPSLLKETVPNPGSSFYHCSGALLTYLPFLLEFSFHKAIV